MSVVLDCPGFWIVRGFGFWGCGGMGFWGFGDLGIRFNTIQKKALRLYCIRVNRWPRTLGEEEDMVKSTKKGPLSGPRLGQGSWLPDKKVP